MSTYRGGAPIKMTEEQAAGVLRYVGFPRSAAVIMLAIGIAESGLVANIIGGPNSDGSYDYGWLQHNSKLPTGPPFWYKPVVNAEMAKVKWAARGYNPWCTYERSACGGNGNGAYRAHLGTAKVAVDKAWAYDKETMERSIKLLNEMIGRDEDAARDVIKDEFLGGGTSLGDVWAAITKFIATLLDWQTWLRIGMAILGAVFLFFALSRFVLPEVKQAIGAIA